MRTTLFATMVLFCSLQLMAQRHMDPKIIEAIKIKKVAFITGQVGLTSNESQKFWPVYNELEKARMDLMDRKRDLEESTEDNTVKSDETYKKLAGEMVGVHMKEAKLIEEYNTKFLSVLPAEKVVKLYRSERKFRSYLMQEMRNKGNNKPGK